MSKLSNKKIILLVGEGDSSKIVYHALKMHFNIAKVVLEMKISRKTFLKRRIIKLGYAKVVGQILFQLLTVRTLKRKAQKRILEIYTKYSLLSNNIPKEKLFIVQSINDSNVLRLLEKSNPDVIVVNGTSIISEKIIHCTRAKMINTHMGITPLYRGVHGAYWALTNNTPWHCGVTVHLIDKGIDTGDIIFQEKITPTKHDNFVTYPFLQLAVALPLLIKAVSDSFNNTLKIKRRDDLHSKLWSHPTIFQYYKNKFLHGVR